jgi:hypothetical protein
VGFFAPFAQRVETSGWRGILVKGNKFQAASERQFERHFFGCSDDLQK